MTTSKPWSIAQVEALYDMPFQALMTKAADVHRTYFPDGDIELATLLSI
jgi:biotin synthase